MSQPFPFSLIDIQAQFGSPVYPGSFVIHDEAAFWLQKRTNSSKELLVVGRADSKVLTIFSGKQQPFHAEYMLKQCPITPSNSQALRSALPWLKPELLGLTTSAGFGDRLGIATPGHILALQYTLKKLPGNDLVPIFAQQSIREMKRTGRTPQDVINDATWGAFQAGWRKKLGADADHLKTLADIDVCADANFTFYTIDPGDYVDNKAEAADSVTIKAKVEALSWQDMQSSPADLQKRLSGKTFDFECLHLKVTNRDLWRAAAKYGAAISHIVKMARHIEAKSIPYELELSVDETETPTSFVEHIYIVTELKRLGVHWVSFAPRFVGRFEKGIDYIGNLDEIAKHMTGHAVIARAMGPYKLSLHSGSDKFSIYPLFSEATRGMCHLKTAGTSYVEALRVIASRAPELFREIYAFALTRYSKDRASYHVSADMSKLPALSTIKNDQLPELIDDHCIRQILHVTFGSVLKKFGSDLKSTLRQHEETYYNILKHHFYRHLEPLQQTPRLSR